MAAGRSGNFDQAGTDHARDFTRWKQKPLSHDIASGSIRKRRDFPAFPAREYFHARETRKQINRSAVQTHHARNIQCKFHFVERFPQIGSLNRAQDSAAFITEDVSLIAVNDSIQAPAALGIAKV
jgi:hypothetical protein